MAALGHLPLACGSVALAQQRADDLRDHVAGALHDDRVARPHVLAVDVVDIMQSGTLYRDATDLDRLQHGEGRQNTGAPTLTSIDSSWVSAVVGANL